MEANDSAKPEGIFGRILQFFQPNSQYIRKQARLLALAALVGVVAGAGAIIFYLATYFSERCVLGYIAGYYPEPKPGGEPTIAWLSDIARPLNLWLLILVPTIGGLLSSFLVFTSAPEAEGDGTDAAIASYHHRQGYIRPRVPPLKIISTALTIGSGGSGGREGPIAQIGAGFGSLLSDLLHLRPAERRVLMAAGMGAGIGAIFRAPLAGTMFAAEVLYSDPEFEPEVIIPTGIASVFSYCVFGLFGGWQPLFVIPDLSFNDPWRLWPYFLLAIVMIVLVSLYTRTYYGCHRLFHRLPIHPCFRTTLGAFLTGVTGVLVYLLATCFVSNGPQDALAVLSFGYSAIQKAITQDTNMIAALLMLIAIGKILTTSLTIGSGGSGGVFGPSIVIGGCGGGAVGVLLHGLWPTLVPHPASFVVVGMAGFFAAAAKTPFSALIIVSEMTGGYALLLPSLWVCTIAYVFSNSRSIYSSQLENRAKSPAHQGSYVQQVLAEVHVSEFLAKQPPIVALRASDALDVVLDRFDTASVPVLPVTGDGNRLLGVIDLEEVHLASQSAVLPSLVLAADLMRSDVQPLTPENTLDRALELFVENDLMALPVVESLQNRALVGLLRRFDVANAYLRRLHGPRAIMR